MPTQKLKLDTPYSDDVTAQLCVEHFGGEGTPIMFIADLYRVEPRTIAHIEKRAMVKYRKRLKALREGRPICQKKSNRTT